MAVYKVVTVPNPVLKQKAQPVKKINDGVLRVLDNLRDTLYVADGVGLAAPQIGISKRMIVVDIGDGLIEMINPEIISKNGEQIGQEGCLSVPGTVGVVNRAQSVTVTGMDRKGNKVEIHGQNLLARVFQHEIDHLDGILFTERAERTMREH